MSDRPPDSSMSFDDQLTAVAQALVAEAPEAPAFPFVPVDTTIAANEAASSRRWSRVGPLAAAALLALVVGLAMVIGRGAEPVADPTVVSQPEAPTPTESQVLFVPLPSELPQQLSATEAERETATKAAVPPTGFGGIALALTDAGVGLGPDGRREIFVYDEPFGEPRRVGPLHADRLLHPTVDGGPLALPIVRGGDQAPWLQVLVPTSAGLRTAWVPRADYEIVFNDRAMVINIQADDGSRIRVVDGEGQLRLDEELVVGPGASPAPFVSAGFVTGASRQEEPTDPIVTGIEMALANLDAGTLPRPVAIGSSQQDLPAAFMVQPETLERLSWLVVPGTRVFVQYGSTLEVEAVVEPAATVSARKSPIGPQRAPIAGLSPLWTSCLAADERWTFCNDRRTPPEPELVVGSSYLIARADAGLAVSAPLVRGATDSSAGSNTDQFDDRAPIVNALRTQPLDPDTRIVTVFDMPDGEPRTLLYRNDVDGFDVPYPLMNPTIFDQPLVLRVVRGLPGDEWLQVQAPTRPTRRSVFVRASDFAFASTTASIEIDARVGGGLAFLDRGEVILRSEVVSARESRPHTFHDTIVDQVLDARDFGPAYGDWIATHNTWSNAFGSYGGGGLPGQSLHGTNQPGLMDQAVSAGGIRVPNEVMTQLVGPGPPGRSAQAGLLGASVIIFHEESNPRESVVAVAWEPAATIEFDPDEHIVAPVPAYS